MIDMYEQTINDYYKSKCEYIKNSTEYAEWQFKQFRGDPEILGKNCITCLNTNCRFQNPNYPIELIIGE